MLAHPCFVSQCLAPRIPLLRRLSDARPTVLFMQRLCIISLASTEQEVTSRSSTGCGSSTTAPQSHTCATQRQPLLPQHFSDVAKHLVFVAVTHSEGGVFTARVIRAILAGVVGWSCTSPLAYLLDEHFIQSLASEVPNAKC